MDGLLPSWFVAEGDTSLADRKDGGGGYERSGAATHSFKIALNPIDPKTGKSAKVAYEDSQPASDQ